MKQGREPEIGESGAATAASSERFAVSNNFE